MTQPVIDRFCRKCGYALVGLDRPRCPECGHGFDPSDPRTFRQAPPTSLGRWAWRGCVVLLVLTALLAILGGWLHIEWKREEDAINTIKGEVPGVVVKTRMIGPKWAQRWMGGPLKYLLTRMDTIELEGASLTKAGWSAIGRLQHLRGLEVASPPQRHLAFLAMEEIAKLGQLKRLSLGDLSLRNAISYNGVGGYRAVQMFDVLDDSALSQLAVLRELEDLNLSGTSITDRGLSHVRSMPRLKSLVLFDTPTTAFGVAALMDALPNCAIAGSGHLRQLPLQRARHVLSISDVLRNEEVDASQREAVNFLRARGIKVWTAERDGRVVAVCILHLDWMVDESQLRAISTLDTLESLELFGDQFSNEFMPHILKLRRLRSLEIVRTNISDEALRDLQQLPHLTQLGLRQCPIGDRAVQHLARLSNLEWLDLGNTRITNAGLAHLGGLRQLKALHLNGTAVTNAGMIHLLTLENLRYLDLRFTAITNKGLVVLSPLKQLSIVETQGSKAMHW